MNTAVEYLMILMSDLHIGTGTPGGGYDDMIAREHRGAPIVPATVIKGATRDALVLAGQHDLTELNRIFGAPNGDGGVVWFSDATRDTCSTGSRSHVALDENRTAIRGALMEIEVVERLVRDTENWRPVVFRGRVELLPGLKADPKALRLVAEGLAHVKSLGAKTRRGYGKVAIGLLPKDVEEVA